MLLTAQENVLFKDDTTGQACRTRAVSPDTVKFSTENFECQHAHTSALNANIHHLSRFCMLPIASLLEIQQLQECQHDAMQCKRTQCRPAYSSTIADSLTTPHSLPELSLASVLLELQYAAHVGLLATICNASSSAAAPLRHTVGGGTVCTVCHDTKNTNERSRDAGGCTNRSLSPHHITAHAFIHSNTAQ